MSTVLKQLIASSGKSVYQVAKGSKLPYTTLNELVIGIKEPSTCSMKTMAALSAYFGISTDALYAKLTGNTSPVTIAHTWDDARRKRFCFPVKVQRDDFDIFRIHPLKQKEAIQIADVVKDDGRVKGLIVFGSASNIRCCRNSDIDVAVELEPDHINNQVKEEVSENIQRACGFDADILWLDRIPKDSKLYSNIEMGVRLK